MSLVEHLTESAFDKSLCWESCGKHCPILTDLAFNIHCSLLTVSCSPFFNVSSLGKAEALDLLGMDENILPHE